MIQTSHFKHYVLKEQLLTAKQNNLLKISVVIPALNEAATIGSIVSYINNKFINETSLIDEIVVIDGGSTDQTVRNAKNAGAIVHTIDQIRPEIISKGKGTALWKSQFVTKGDLLVFIDSDILDFDERFIYGLIGPLLLNPKIDFVKSFYKRPLLHGDSLWENQGGRVTEILVRPLLSTFIPDVAHLIQPLSGEYAIRRSLMKTLNIWSGYGVEIGLLLDIYFTMGFDKIIQIDMGCRRHRNRSVEELSKMSFCILQVILNRLEKYGFLSVSTHFSAMVMNSDLGLFELECKEEELLSKALYALEVD